MYYNQLLDIKVNENKLKLILFFCDYLNMKVKHIIPLF